MEYKGCFDTVHGLIEDASKEFGAAFVVSPEKSGQVSRACEKVDALFEEIDCSVIDASVNMDNKVLTISIFCDEVILENGRENGFCKLLQEVTSFSISKAAENTLRLDMNIAGVWQAT